MIRSVRLERLPKEIHFPHELTTKISFDPGSQQLRFDGFMSKTDFDKLVRLHNDLSYQRALEQLFQISTFNAPKRPSRLRQMPLVFTGIIALIAFTTLVFLLRH